METIKVHQAIQVDRRVTVAVLLVALICLLAFFGYRSEAPSPQQPVMKETATPIPQNEIDGIIDRVLVSFGSTRPRRITAKAGGMETRRTEVRTEISPSIDPLRIVSMLQDSLRRFEIGLVATENTRQRSTSVHLRSGKQVFETITIMRKELQKGEVPSQSKIQKPAKVRR
jgi:hypothetical protein